MKKLPVLFLLFVCASAIAQPLTGPAAQILVPAAGNVAGLNGTFFRSDITILNYRDVNQNVLAQWLPQGQTGTAAQSQLLTINARSGILSEDFVNNVLHQSGLGAILLTAVTSEQAPDPNGALFVTSRIWSPQRDNPSGTVSQTLPAVNTARINSTDVAILGQRINDQYRTNVGIVNLSSATRVFEVLQSSDDPTLVPLLQTVAIPPRSMQQLALFNNRATALQVRVRAVSVMDPRLWIAYGSTVDNNTGDSWSSLGVTTVLTP
jgi:hypothetical protein